MSDVSHLVVRLVYTLFHCEVWMVFNRDCLTLASCCPCQGIYPQAIVHVSSSLTGYSSTTSAWKTLILLSPPLPWFQSVLVDNLSIPSLESSLRLSEDVLFLPSQHQAFIVCFPNPLASASHCIFYFRGGRDQPHIYEYSYPTEHTTQREYVCQMGVGARAFNTKGRKEVHWRSKPTLICTVSLKVARSVK